MVEGDNQGRARRSQRVGAKPGFGVSQEQHGGSDDPGKAEATCRRSENMSQKGLTTGGIGWGGLLGSIVQ